RVTQKSARKKRHVTGRELLDGIRRLGLERFGPMAPTVFEAWGVRRTADFGEIVFNMVEIGFLGKTDTDSRDDFKDGYDFDAAFRKPFQPATCRIAGTPASEQN